MHSLHGKMLPQHLQLCLLCHARMGTGCCHQGVRAVPRIGDAMDALGPAVVAGAGAGGDTTRRGGAAINSLGGAAINSVGGAAINSLGGAARRSVGEGTGVTPPATARTTGMVHSLATIDGELGAARLSDEAELGQVG